VQEVISDRDILECQGVPRHLWTTKCVYLHNDDRIAVGEGICYSIKSNLVVGSTGPLGDTQVAIQISKSLKLDEFPDDWRYSVRAWPITHVLSLIVKGKTRLHDLVAADEDRPLLK
jgi:hypothetical protein